MLSSMTLPPDLQPKEAIDTFVTMFRDQLEIVHRGHQLILRRRVPLCAEQDTRYCSPIGTHVYDWFNKRLIEPSANREVKLSEGDRKAIELLLFSIELGETRPSAKEVGLSGLSEILKSEIGISPK